MVTASAHLDDARFSQTFELPADEANGRAKPFKVTYADYGYRNEADPEQENVFFFFVPLMGSRWMHVAKDALAKRHKVRFISLDRPGIGGTDAVDAEHVMIMWREVATALLKHLGIEYVSLGCHSGGAVSALDMALHHPELLHPERPYLVLGAPWILPSHTSSTTMSLVQSLPAGLIGTTDKFARFMNSTIGPALGVCFGASAAIVSRFKPAATTQAESSEDVEQDTPRDDAKFEEKIWPDLIKRVYAEGIKGLSAHAQLILQKDGGWSDWGDYDTLVPRLVEDLRAAGKRLKVRVYYAEKDMLIGDAYTKGPLWFDGLWDEQKCGDVVDYERQEVKGAEHDGVWDIALGVPQKVFEEIGQPVEQS